MSRTHHSVGLIALVLSMSFACSVEMPLTPGVAPGAGPTSGADGATLKVGAPALVSPINSDTITTQLATFTISPAVGQFSNQTFDYEFELQNDAGATLARGVGGTSFTMPSTLTIGTPYRWRARATLGGQYGPY